MHRAMQKKALHVDVPYRETSGLEVSGRERTALWRAALTVQPSLFVVTDCSGTRFVATQKFNTRARGFLGVTFMNVTQHAPPSDGFIRRLILRHVPTFWLIASDDHAHPSSFRFFLTKSRAVCSTTGSVLLSSIPDVDALRSLIDKLDAENSSTTIRLELLSASARLGERDVPLDDVPVYCSVKAVYRDESVEAYELTFVTLFAYNGSYFFGMFGHHDGDIEHLTVRCDPAGRMQAVWFNSHRNVDGHWVAASDVEIDDVGRIVSFIARGGHGHYGSEGTTPRHYFFASDHCRREVRWRPNRVIWIEECVHRIQSRGIRHELDQCVGGIVVNPSEEPELEVEDRHSVYASPRITAWGEAAGLPHQRWWSDSPEPSRSRKWYERLFTLPFHFMDVHELYA